MNYSPYTGCGKEGQKQMANTSGNILAIDQGTTNTKVLLVNPAGGVIARASRPVTLRFPHPAWVEQDATAIWQSVREAMEECLIAVDNPHPAAIALTNQREAVMMWTFVHSCEHEGWNLF